MAEKINIVFKCNPKCWESDWIHELFDLDSFEIQPRNFFGENCIVVTDNPRLCLFRDFINNHLDFLLINLKDEFIPSKQDHAVYESKYCKYIFRNYFRKKYISSKISAFPLGYKLDFWKGFNEKDRLLAQLNSNRKYIWSFAGVAKKSGRRKALWSLDKLQPNFVHAVSGWDSNDSLNTDEYRELLCNSYFVPCFRGNCSLECFRIYESLECGAIPIVQKTSHIETFDFWREWLGIDHPLPTVNDIHSNETHNYINQLNDNPQALNEKRLEIIEWWNNYKKDYKIFASNIIKDFSSNEL